MTTTALVPSAKAKLPLDSRLSAHAKRIRGLMVDLAKNSLELGRELEKAQNYFKSLPKSSRPRAKFSDWIEEEFKVSNSWAYLLIKTAKQAASQYRGHSHEVIGILTATPSARVPAAAIEEMKAQIKDGKKLSTRAAQRILRKHKRGGNGSKIPSPTEAREIAAKHHIIVAASDGRLYTGASEEAVKEAEDKRTIVYGVRRALETLANISIGAKEFLNYADPHQLWTKEEEWVLVKAAKWLNSLVENWRVLDV